MNQSMLAGGAQTQSCGFSGEINVTVFISHVFVCQRTSKQWAEIS